MRNIIQILYREWALSAALAFFLLAVLCIELPVLQFTHGLIVYPQDTTYLQLATSKNLAFDHSWDLNIGFTHTPGPTSFSILYSWLLALLFMGAGPLVFIPLLVNLAAGITLLVVIHKWLAAQQIGRRSQLISLIALIFFSSLPVLVAQGMEDTLQMLGVVLFVYELSAWLHAQSPMTTPAAAALPAVTAPTSVVAFPSAASNTPAAPPDIPGRILLYGMLVMTIRFEGILLVLVACILLCTRRQWACAMELAFGSVLPFICYGLYYLYWDKHFVLFPRGWWPPVSGTLWLGPLYVYVLILVAATSLIFGRTLRKTAQYRYILLLLMGTAAVQLFTIGAHLDGGWHGAWLIAGAIPVTGVLVARYGRQLFKGDIATAMVDMIHQFGAPGRLILPALILILTLPLSWKSGEGFRTTVDSCMVMYKQEYQMARFLTSYYNRDNAAVNDIGVTAYLKYGSKFDLVGSSVSDSALVDSLMWKAGAKIAVISDSLYSHVLLSDWSKIASWQIDDRPTPGVRMLSFYAVDSVASDDLKKKLRAFQHSLPPGVAVRYYWGG